MSTAAIADPKSPAIRRRGRARSPEGPNDEVVQVPLRLSREAHEKVDWMVAALNAAAKKIDGLPADLANWNRTRILAYGMSRFIARARAAREALAASPTAG